MKRINSADRRELRVNLCNRYGGRCSYCNTSAGLRSGTVDHYLPEALGGGNERANLRWSCLACNHAKDCMHPNEWERVRPTLRPWVETPADAKVRILQHIARLARGVSA
jgi:5-methylcytosine-specific restriction endonuclease McrA